MVVLEEKAEDNICRIHTVGAMNAFTQLYSNPSEESGVKWQTDPCSQHGYNETCFPPMGMKLGKDEQVCLLTCRGENTHTCTHMLDFLDRIKIPGTEIVQSPPGKEILSCSLLTIRLLGCWLKVNSQGGGDWAHNQVLDPLFNSSYLPIYVHHCSHITPTGMWTTSKKLRVSFPSTPAESPSQLIKISRWHCTLFAYKHSPQTLRSR